MPDLYKISFRVSPFQEFNKGSLVTYKDENLLSWMKENLYSRSNFFYVENIDWIEYSCDISNGIDSMRSSPDQLLEVIAYAERITGIASYNYGESIVENMIKYQENLVNQDSFILEDQKIGIFLEDSTFSNEYFRLIESTISYNSSLKNYKKVRFIESKISELL
jgi:hypothetical protein